MQKLYELNIKNKIEIGVLIAAPFLFFSLIFLFLPGTIDVWNLRLSDQLFRLKGIVKGNEPVSVRIIHVDLNDSSAGKLKEDIFNKRLYADMVRILSEARVSQIVFDIIFSSYSTTDNEKLLVDALSDSKSAYMPVVPRIQEGKVEDLSGIEFADNLDRGFVWYPIVKNIGRPPSSLSILSGSESFINVSKGVGHIFCEPDVDGVYRRFPLLIKYGDGYIPGLSLRIAADYLSVRPDNIEVKFGSYILFKNAVFPGNIKRDLKIPIDKSGNVVINFAGKWTETFFHYSFDSILKAGISGSIDDLRDQIEGTIAVVSDITTRGKDHGTIPLEKVYPMSGVHSNLINSIITENFISNIHMFFLGLIYLVFLSFLWGLGVVFKPIKFLIFSLLLYLLLVCFFIFLFIFFNKTVNLITPTFSFVVSFVSVILYRYFTALKTNIDLIVRLNQASTKFVPTEILKYLGKTELTDLHLGDQSQHTMSILFSDIRSFTTLSENLTPEQNFNFLNSYFNRMGPVIRNNRGFIDKYIGDAIMALFPNCADDAFRAAIEMRNQLRIYNRHRGECGYIAIDIGIGIHIGSMMLGIIGEDERYDGTVISDAVNLSSRLEGLTKYYGAGIIVSDSLINKLSDPTIYRYRLLDFVRVKGKLTPVSIYEVFQDYSDPLQEMKIETAIDYERALMLYLGGNFEESLQIFNAILIKNPYDRAVKNFVSKCEENIRNGVSETWDGVESF